MVFFLLLLTILFGTCPCSQKSLCDPISRTYVKEIFGFVLSPSAEFWDWLLLDDITTIAWAPVNDTIMCWAHSKNVRLIQGAGMTLSSLDPDPAVRKLWIEQTFTRVEKAHMDGIIFDYESPMTLDDPRNQYYVQLVNETARYFHAQNPYYQISVCVAWSPHDIDGRAYDYTGLADAADFLYVMDYDTKSQVFDRCLAGPNSPSSTAKHGLEEYIRAGVPVTKLILGVPWYGYNYTCTNDMESPMSKFCPIAYRPWRGTNCSDAVGNEVTYGEIMKLLNSGNFLTDLTIDESGGVFFNYYCSSSRLSVCQMWFDNPWSLNVKYSMARDMGIRGVGPYRFDQVALDSKLERSQADLMFDALRTFLSK